MIDFYGDMLTEKQREVVELYYNEDLSLAEIADHSMITRQGVRDSIKRAEAQLLLYEEKLGLAKRFRAMQEKLDKIRETAEKINEYNDKFSLSIEIREMANQIMQYAEELSE